MEKREVSAGPWVTGTPLFLLHSAELQTRPHRRVVPLNMTQDNRKAFTKRSQPQEDFSTNNSFLSKLDVLNLELQDLV